MIKGNIYILSYISIEYLVFYNLNFSLEFTTYKNKTVLGVK